MNETSFWVAWWSALVVILALMVVVTSVAVGLGKYHQKGRFAECMEARRNTLACELAERVN